MDVDGVVARARRVGSSCVAEGEAKKKDRRKENMTGEFGGRVERRSGTKRRERREEKRRRRAGYRRTKKGEKCNESAGS